MLTKRVSATEEEIKERFKKVPGFNDAYRHKRRNEPPLFGIKCIEITQAEYCKSVANAYYPEFTDYGQIRPEHFTFLDDPIAHVLSVNISYYHTGEVFLVYSDYWGGRLRFFRQCLCLHRNYTTKNIGNCLNTHTCSDCGYKWTVDSSD